MEFSELMIFNNTAEIFARLQDAGMIPVITHPERNALLRQRIAQIADWINAGACVQITGQSVVGGFDDRRRSSAKRCSTGAWCISWRATATIASAARPEWMRRTRG